MRKSRRSARKDLTEHGNPGRTTRKTVGPGGNPGRTTGRIVGNPERSSGGEGELDFSSLRRVAARKISIFPRHRRRIRGNFEFFSSCDECSGEILEVSSLQTLLPKKFSIFPHNGRCSDGNRHIWRTPSIRMGAGPGARRPSEGAARPPGCNAGHRRAVSYEGRI